MLVSDWSFAHLKEFQLAPLPPLLLQQSPKRLDIPVLAYPDYPGILAVN